MMRLWLVCVLVVLLVGGACIHVSTSLEQDVDRLKGQVRAVDDEIAPVIGGIPKVTQLRDATEQQKTATMLYGDFPRLIGADTAAVAHILAEVEKSRPATVTVTRMSLKPGGQPLGLGFIGEAQPGHAPPPLPVLELSATALDRRDLETFQTSLSRLPLCERLRTKQREPLQLEMWCKAMPPP